MKCGVVDMQNFIFHSSFHSDTYVSSRLSEYLRMYIFIIFRKVANGRARGTGSVNSRTHYLKFFMGRNFLKVFSSWLKGFSYIRRKLNAL